MYTRMIKIFTMLTLMLVMVGSASATELCDEVDMPAPADVLEVEESDTSSEDVLEERQDIDGEMTVYAGKSYKTILTSTNYDYVNGANLRISFLDSEGCEAISVAVEEKENGEWVDIGERELWLGETSDFADVRYLNDFRIRIKASNGGASNVVLHIKMMG